jgi:hypothetical protein
MSCDQRHKETDACLGRPLCPDCYDYPAAVVWNAHAPELWRRTTIAIRRRLNRLARDHGTRIRMSYAKVAEFQARGLVHFHAIFRLDGTDPARLIPPAHVSAAHLADASRRATPRRFWANRTSQPRCRSIQTLTRKPAVKRSPSSTSFSAGVTDLNCG